MGSGLRMAVEVGGLGVLRKEKLFLSAGVASAVEGADCYTLLYLVKWVIKARAATERRLFCLARGVTLPFSLFVRKFSEPDIFEAALTSLFLPKLTPRSLLDSLRSSSSWLELQELCFAASFARSRTPENSEDFGSYITIFEVSDAI
jgi:hypothetical protein